MLDLRPDFPTDLDTRQQAQRDEEEALKSLDDASLTRTMPQPIPLWEPDDSADTTPATPATHSRMPTIALICIVGVASFVAGGMTARLSSQVPLLFPQKAEPQTEVSTAYAPVTSTTDAQQEQGEAEVEGERNVWEYAPETSYEYGEDVPDSEPVAKETSPAPDAPSYRWDFDSEGDRSISYDTDDNRVTFDYDGYLFSMDLDDLMAEPEEDTSEAEPEERDPYLYDKDTDSDHGYDRDAYGWTRQVWGGSWT